MKNLILKLIYRRFAAKFEDFFVEDYVKEIPSNVKQSMETVLDSQKDKIRRANDFLAFGLHQRIRNDPRNSERYQGMFIQLKLMDAMLKGRPDIKPETPAQVAKPEVIFDYETNINNAIEKYKKK